MSERHILFQHADRTRGGKCLHDFAFRERSHQAQFEHSGSHAPGAQPVHGFAHNSGHTAQGDQHHVRALAAIGHHCAAVAATKTTPKLLVHLARNPLGAQDGPVLLHLELGVVGRPSGEAHVRGCLKTHFAGRAKRRQEGVHVCLCGNIHRLVGVGQHKAVEIQHHWGQHLGVLGNGKALDGHVQCLLGVFDVDLDPAARQHRQRILLIAIDIPGQGQRPVGVHHYDGKAPAAGVLQTLRHVEQALGRSCGEGARSEGAGTHACRKRRVF